MWRTLDVSGRRLVEAAALRAGAMRPRGGVSSAWSLDLFLKTLRASAMRPRGRVSGAWSLDLFLETGDLL